MFKSQNERMSKARVVRFGDREIVTEGLHLSFWADISHRCMTASWPSFIGGAALVFVAFNAVFAVFYWIGDQPISNVPGGAYIDYLYFSIETLSTAGYGDMHPQTHYGHFVATVELFTGIFSMSLMTGTDLFPVLAPECPAAVRRQPGHFQPRRQADPDGSPRQRTSQHHQQCHRQTVAVQEYREHGGRAASQVL